MSETRPELENIRVQTQYGYIGNTPGESLKSVMTTIDSMLRESSPDMMAPGLLNWIHKDLFMYRWKNASGDAAVQYNEYGESKIAKGRYEIIGNGRVYFDRFVAVSEIRGVTGRIFFGATEVGATVTVGVECFDKDQNSLGDNGGFIAHQKDAPVGSWSFYKSSCFSESPTEIRRLKPGTRFVKLFIEVSGNTDIIYFDESELTVFEVDERYMEVFSPDIDFNLAEFFAYKPSTDQTITVRNGIDGKVKTISIENTGAADIEITFPSYFKWQGGSGGSSVVVIIKSGSTSIFSVIIMGGEYYASVIEELS